MADDIVIRIAKVSMGYRARIDDTCFIGEGSSVQKAVAALWDNIMHIATEEILAKLRLKANGD